jgi:hypothetical protein
MRSSTNRLSWALLAAALMAAPVAAALLLSLLIGALAPKELQPTMLALIAAVPVTLYCSRPRRQALAAPE